MNEVEYVLRVILKARDEMARVFGSARTQVMLFSASVRRADKDLDGVNSRISSMNLRLGNLNKRLDASGEAFKRFASTKRGADKDIDRNVDLFERLAGAVGGLSKYMTAADREIRKHGTEHDRLGSSVRGASREFDTLVGSIEHGSRSAKGMGTSIGQLDNNLRGMGLLLVFGFAQQLITGLIGLGGELVSVASSAVMAGGAIGGNFAAGLLQALPGVLIFAGAIHRLTQVMQAVSLQSKLQQANFVDQSKKGDNAAKTTDQVANANDGLRDALQRVTEAQEAVNDARQKGIRQLQDLVFAEKEATLAAKGAALSQRDAQIALQEAIQSGGDVQGAQLNLQEAIVRNQKSSVESTRATSDRRAAGGNVENLPDVQGAEKQLAQANQSVTRAERSVDQAKRSAVDAAGSVQTAAANLNFFLTKELDDSERKLYEAIIRIQTRYKQLFRPVTDIIIDSFTVAVNRAAKLIEMPEVVAEARKTAHAIAGAIDSMTGTLSSGPVVKQLLDIAAAGRKNIAPLTGILTDLGKAFINIADAAGPALSRTIDWVGKLADNILGVTSNGDKLTAFFDKAEDNLEAWLNLGLAVVKMLAALMGAGAADEGLKSVNDASKAIDGVTDKINANKDKIAKFFSDARKITVEVVGVLVEVGKEALKAFDPDNFKNMADIFKDVVLPALGQIVRTIGKVSDGVSTILNIPFIRDFTKWGLIIAAFSLSATSAGRATKLVGDSMKFTGGQLKAIPDAIKSVGDKFKTASQAVQGFGDRLKLQAHLGEMEGRAGKLTAAMERLAPAFISAGAGAETFWAFLIGPWGLAIIAVVAGIVLLLHHFNQFPVIVKGAKDAWKAFKDAVAPALKDLSDAFDSMGIHIHSGGQALKVLNEIGKTIASFIAQYLIGNLKGVADVVAGIAVAVIRALAGIINILHGLVEIWVGIYDLIFHGDGSKISDGMKKIVLGLLEIFEGVVEGVFRIIKGIVEIILSPFKAAWKAVKRFFGVNSPSKLAMELGQAILDGIIAGIKAIGSKLSGVASWIWDKLVSFIHREIRGATNIGKWIVDTLSDGVHAIGKDLESIGTRIITALVNGIKAAPQVIADAIDWLLDKVPGGSLIKKGLSALGGAERKVLGALTPGFTAGGPVAGSGNGDSVVARLTPGEHVLTKGEVAAAGGHGVIFALRSLLGGGRQGGPFGYNLGGSVSDASVFSNTLDTRLPSGASTATPAVIAARRAAETRNRQNDLKTEREDYKKSNDQKALDWSVMWNDMLTTARRATNDIQTQIREMRVAIQKTFDRTNKDTQDSWSSTWQSLAEVTYDGLFYIGHEANRALHAMGEATIDFGLALPSIKRQGGGMIPGSGDGDKVPVLAEPGEGFINKRAVRALGGPSFINMLNNAIPRFQAGGVVGNLFDGHPANVIPGIRQLIELMKRHFPELVVTSTTDHSIGTSTGGTSDHPSGHAVDLTSSQSVMTKATNYILSSGLWKKLKQGIHNPGLAINQGKKVDGPGFFAEAWPEHTTHLHLALAGALGAVADVIANIGALTVNPKGGGMSNIAQAALNKIRAAANKQLAKAGGDMDSLVSMGGGAHAEEIFRYFRRRGFSDEQSAAWVGNFTQESGLNPAIVQPNGEGHGLAQWGGPRFAALQTFAKSRNKPWQDMQTQLDFVWHELQTSEGGAYMGIKSATNLLDAVNAVGRLYERFGIAGDRSGPARSALAQFGGKFDEGGEVPGPLGKMVGIFAHAGEWVLNPMQQARAAMLSGLSIPGLRSMLGFHGAGGAKGYAGGGDIPAATIVGPLATSGIAKFIDSHIKEAFTNLEKLTDSLAKRTSLGSVQGFIKNLDKVQDGLAKASKLIDHSKSAKDAERGTKAFLDVVENLTGDAGLLGRLRAAIERRVAQATRQIAANRFAVGAGRKVTEQNSPLEQAQDALDEQRRQRGDLTGERSEIMRQLKQVQARQRGKNLDPATKQRLQAQENSLNTALDDANQRVSDNVAAIFAAQQAALQAGIDAQQKIVDDITKSADRKTSFNELSRRIGTLFGNEGLIAQVNDNQRNILTKEANDLEARIGAARAAGANDLADDLELKVADIRTSIQEALAQELTDAASRIGDRATRSTSRLDLADRMLTAVGAVGRTAATAIGGQAFSRTGIAQQRQDVISQSQTDTQALLAKVLATQPDNQKLIDQLNDSLVELTVQMQEAKLADFQARLEDLNTRTGYDTTMNDLNAQVIQLQGAISGNTDVAQLLALAQAKQQTLIDKQNGLLGLQAEVSPDSQQYKDLAQALLENKVAMLQNTQSINELNGTVTDPQTFTSSAWTLFREAVFDGMGNVLPRYELPASAVNNMLSSGAYNVNPGDTSMMSTTSEGDINLTINEAGQPVDTTELITTLGFLKKTNQ